MSVEPLVVGLAVGVLIAVINILRMNRGTARDLSRLEAKLDALLKHQGIRFDPYAEVPPRVADALRRGKKIEAIKEYRASTGAGLKDAKQFVDEIQRRAAPRT
jgi:ribosomal L7/L12-like protein